jgi:hypothetical protein
MGWRTLEITMHDMVVCHATRCKSFEMYPGQSLKGAELAR